MIQNNKTFISILLLMLAMQCSCLLGQNVIQFHRKDGKQKDYIVKTGRRAKIKTIDNQTIRGKINEIKDSSIIVSKKAIDIPVNKIRYFYCRKNNFSKALEIVCFASLTNYAVYEAVDIGIAMGLALGLAIGTVFIPVPYIGTIYFLTHKKKYNMQSKYDLSIVKPK